MALLNSSVRELDKIGIFNQKAIDLKAKEEDVEVSDIKNAAVIGFLRYLLCVDTEKDSPELVKFSTLTPASIIAIISEMVKPRNGTVGVNPSLVPEESSRPESVNTTTNISIVGQPRLEMEADHWWSSLPFAALVSALLGVGQVMYRQFSSGKASLPPFLESIKKELIREGTNNNEKYMNRFVVEGGVIYLLDHLGQKPPTQPGQPLPNHLTFGSMTTNGYLPGLKGYKIIGGQISQSLLEKFQNWGQNIILYSHDNGELTK